jgi:hypothetical protein
MLWPAPKRGDGVALSCGCAAIVKMALPLVFLYAIQISVLAPRCRRSHRSGSIRFVRLEEMRALEK